MNYETS